jgi:hypothetical protein
LWRNARHPEGNSYSYEEKCPPVDVPHSPKLIIATRLLYRAAFTFAVVRALKNGRTGFCTWDALGRKTAANQIGTLSRWNKGEQMP